MDDRFIPKLPIFPKLNINVLFLSAASRTSYVIDVRSFVTGIAEKYRENKMALFAFTWNLVYYDLSSTVKTNRVPSLNNQSVNFDRRIV